MLTQADRYELKRHITDILNDTGLPPYLKVNRLADLLEDRFIATGLEIPAFEESLSHFLPPARARARKSPDRQQTTRRKNATSTRASARKRGRSDVSA
jgi:hypothetical protein